VTAERAARDAATNALTAERARVTPAPAPVHAPYSSPIAVPEPPPALAHPPAAETDALIVGLARAAERLRAQAPPEDVAAAPPEHVAPAAPPAPAPVAAAPEPAASPVAAAPLPRRGGLLGALERALRNVR